MSSHSRHEHRLFAQSLLSQVITFYDRADDDPSPPTWNLVSPVTFVTNTSALSVALTNLIISRPALISSCPLCPTTSDAHFHLMSSVLIMLQKVTEKVEGNAGKTASQTQLKQCFTEVLVSPWPGPPWWQSPPTDGRWKMHSGVQNTGRLHNWRERQCCVSLTSLGTTNLSSQKMSWGNLRETTAMRPGVIYKQSGCSNASRRMETVIFLIL